MKIQVLYLILLKCFSISIPYTPKSIDSYYKDAEYLLNNDSKDSFLILNNLLQSKSPESQALLGELYLLGHHVPYNASKALEYFQEAYKNNSTEAGFYLYLLLHQSLYFNLTDFDLPSPSEKLLKSFYKSSISRGSILTKVFAIVNYFRCESEFYPSFIKKKQIFDIYCNHTIRQIAEYSLEIAQTAIKKIIDQGRSNSIPKPLDEESLYGSSVENLLILTSKSFETYNKKYLSILADYYLIGNPTLGIEKNFTRSLLLYEQAASVGSISAHNALATIYTTGVEGIGINLTKAVDHWLEAFDKGSIHAMTGLGYIFINYIDFIDSIDYWLEVMEYAAERGDTEAMNTLGLLYVQADNPTLGIYYLKLAAGQGYLPAVYNLGLIYMQGLDGEKKYNQAIDSFWKVIAVGPLSRYCRLGYAMGKTKKYFGSYWAYALSSLLGYENSLNSIKYLTLHRKSPYECVGSIDICLSYYNIVLAQLGNLEAYYELGKLVYKDNGYYQSNYTEAYKLFHMAHNVGEAMYYKAYMNEIGLGVTQNFSNAKLLYQNIIDKTITEVLPKENYFPAVIGLIRIRLWELFNWYIY